jgi:hypothetical protein
VTPRRKPETPGPGQEDFFPRNAAPDDREARPDASGEATPDVGSGLGGLGSAGGARRRGGPYGRSALGAAGVGHEWGILPAPLLAAPRLRRRSLTTTSVDLRSRIPGTPDGDKGSLTPLSHGPLSARAASTSGIFASFGAASTSAETPDEPQPNAARKRRATARAVTRASQKSRNHAANETKPDRNVMHHSPRSSSQ